MELKTLSASSADCYENCPKRWQTLYTSSVRVQEGPSLAADKGSACHEALEHFVLAMLAGDKPGIKELLAWFDMAWWKLFTDRNGYDDGKKMLMTWHARTVFGGHKTVLHAEVKKRFPIKTDAGEKLVTYIFDRVDREYYDDGTYDIRVIDYKTWSQPMKPEALRNKIQTRTYSVAARLEYPDARRIWVEMDQLRFEPVAVSYTIEEDRDTFRYLKRLANRIIADRDPAEKVGTDCRWCVRRHECVALNAHVKAGGKFAISDPMSAADRRRELVFAKQGLGAMINDLDDYLIDYLSTNDLLELETKETKLSVTARRSRTVDPERVAAVIGPELSTKYRTLGVATVDKLLKGNELTPEQKLEVKALVRNEWAEPSIKTEARAPIEVK